MATSKADAVMSTPVPTKAHTSKEATQCIAVAHSCKGGSFRGVALWMGSLPKPFASEIREKVRPNLAKQTLTYCKEYVSALQWPYRPQMRDIYTKRSCSEGYRETSEPREK